MLWVDRVASRRSGAILTQNFCRNVAKATKNKKSKEGLARHFHPLLHAGYPGALKSIRYDNYNRAGLTGGKKSLSKVGPKSPGLRRTPC